jgi:O-antigen ligase
MVTVASTSPPLSAATEFWERVAFWAAVFVVLMFSQCWVMPLTGPPTLADVDPAVSATVRNFYFPVYLVVLVLGFTNLAATAKSILQAPALALLVTMTFISMTWSIDPDVTLRRSTAVFFTSLAGVVVVSRFTWPKFLEVLATAFAVVVILCFIFGLFFPRYGRMTVEFPGAWQGVWSQKNTLGFNMSIGFMVFAAAAIASPPRRWFWMAGAVAALALLILSQSKTSLVSFAGGCACIGMVLLARRGPVGAVAATFIGGSALAALIFTIVVDPNLLLGLLGKDATLTGRTKIWAAVLHQIHLRPLTGYGYGAVWDNTSVWGPLPWISKEQGFTIHEAHNSWLGVWLELGYLGLTTAIVLFLELWGRTVFAVYGQMRAYLALPFMAVFTLHTMTETEILVQNDWLWVMFTAIAIKLAAPTETATVGNVCQLQ